ncbi:MAG: hypothetical protein FJY97_15330 [candidate division Zixibacteria bacterium]|nr:hypothetical protein [candidate division Zixibacteria bacterium]
MSLTTASPPESPPEAAMPVVRSSGVTLRSALLGLFCAVAIAIVAPHAQFVMRSSVLTADYFSPAPFMLLFLVFLVMNVALRAFRETFALTPQELLVVLIMGMVSAGFATNGFSSPFIAVVTAPYLSATPENRWAEYFFAHIPEWAVVHDQHNALTYYRDGLPPGASIPWEAWTLPLLWWLSLMAAIVFMALCITVILRKQWVENEKLVFPLMQVPLALIQGTETPPFYSRLFRNRIFWAGFAIPVIPMCWNIAGYFTTTLPFFPYFGNNPGVITVVAGVPVFFISFYPSVVGIAYFVNLDVLAGLWFFYLLGMIEFGMFNESGITIPGYDNYSADHAAVGWQNMGAFCLLVIWVLWRGRQHIRAVFAQAFGRRSDLDDSDEFFSYRTAVFGLIGGTVYALLWLNQLGISLFVGALFLTMVFFIYIGTSRIIMESGVPFIRGPMIAQVFAFYTVGSANMTPQTMTGLALTYGALGEIKSSFMPQMTHSAKLAEQGKGWGRSLGWVIGLACTAGLLVSLYWHIHMAYTYGAKTMNSWWFLLDNIGGKIPFDQTLVKMKDPFGPDWIRLLCFGVGAGFMWLFMWLRARYTWWPVHPIGFTVINAHPIRYMMVSIFFAWLIKRILLWIGGVELYRKAQPLFIGLVIGYFTGVALSMMVDFIWFPQAGHHIYGID